jgi:tetratricopeptide (TPR) repeat protein
MSDIFDIQEQVAEKVIAGLKVHLSLNEKRHLAARGASNAEAYEMLLKGKDYFERQTKDGFHIAIRLFSQAIELDPDYAGAYQAKAHTLAILYSNYERNPELLTEAESLCKEALRLRPDLLGPYGPLSLIYMYEGRFEEAEAIAKDYIQKAPENSKSHFSLGYLYAHSGQPAKAIEPFEEAMRLNPESRFTAFNLVINCKAAKETERSKRWALAAVPLFERLLKLQPDSDNIRVNYAAMLVLGGRNEDALREARSLTRVTDGFQLHNIACTFSLLDEKKEALATFRISA